MVRAAGPGFRAEVFDCQAFGFRACAEASSESCNPK